MGDFKEGAPKFVKETLVILGALLVMCLAAFFLGLLILKIYITAT